MKEHQPLVIKWDEIYRGDIVQMWCNSNTNLQQIDYLQYVGRGHVHICYENRKLNMFLKKNVLEKFDQSKEYSTSKGSIIQIVCWS